MYQYSATCDRVVDGDTVYLIVDLGFNLTAKLDFRLAGINAPELHGATHDAGLKSKQWLEHRITSQQLTIETQKTDKYGRWLVTIFVTSEGMVKSINDEMVELGLAVVYL